VESIAIVELRLSVINDYESLKEIIISTEDTQLSGKPRKTYSVMSQSKK
jgi:hypothetical protein